MTSVLASAAIGGFTFGLIGGFVGFVYSIGNVYCNSARKTNRHASNISDANKVVASFTGAVFDFGLTVTYTLFSSIIFGTFGIMGGLGYGIFNYHHVF